MVLKKRTKKRTTKKEQFNHHIEEDNGFELQTKIIPAADQLDLPEEELERVHTKLLEALNPNAPTNPAYFDFEERVFKWETNVGQTAFHFEVDGDLIKKDSEEAKSMKELEEKKSAMLEEKLKKEIGTSTEEEQAVAMMDEEERAEKRRIDVASLHNQFNYSQRSTMTNRNKLTTVTVNTVPPPTEDYSDMATQWQIYDSYIEMLAKQKAEEDEEESGEKAKKAIVESVTKDDILSSESLLHSVKLVERMINQNRDEDILEDFKYWEDRSDEYRDLGVLLPLWKFINEDTKKRQVTGLCWNPAYHDLFAVSFGSYDFNQVNAPGAICCYSLKNPAYPEYMFFTDVGVTAIDFHPDYPSLLAVGMRDGTCAIYDVHAKPTENPIIRSSIRTGKHQDIIWQVRWDTNSNGRSLKFFAVSSDGRVSSWSLAKNELQYTDIIYLKPEKTDDVDRDVPGAGMVNEETEEKKELLLLRSGTCFDFNKKKSHIFLVGTEDGLIHKCSKAYNSQYLETYKSHQMDIYAVRWNYFHENLFLSASADWTVKLWDYKNPDEPLLSFDLGASVGDIAWAPYSASVFAACTDDGRVHVFDLSVNKHDSLCDQLVVKRAKLTHISFNPTDPIILVGDDKGLTQTLKLSPNLKKANDKLVLDE